VWIFSHSQSNLKTTMCYESNFWKKKCVHRIKLVPLLAKRGAEVPLPV
jgi:hypothetical protein